MYFFYIFKKFFLILKIYYLKTSFYNYNISKNIPSKYLYLPSPHIINCLLYFNKKKFKIEKLSLNSIWKIDPKKNIEFGNLHNFLWLIALDIKTSKTSTQNLIENWIDNNRNFNEQTWALEILSKRIIAWISNSNLTLNLSNFSYKEKLILSIAKQTNHLFKNIENEKNYEHKIIGCTSLILVGLVFKEYKKYFDKGLEILEKTIKINFDSNGFPKSRNPQELCECLKYFVIVREWIKESQKEIPEFINKIVYESGNSFSFISKKNIKLPLFNGATELNNEEFKVYLKNTGYNFKENSKEKSGYTILENKKILLVMDVGSPPEKKFSKKYQCGCLSFEIISGNKKLICNSGFYFKNKNKLNIISKSTAAHSTLYINNQSSCSIKRRSFLNNNYNTELFTSLNIKSKKITTENEFDQIIASHDGYQKKFGIIHERKIKFLKKSKIFFGEDIITSSKKFEKNKFGIRFHIYPGTKMVKTQDPNSILLRLDNGDGWRFNCQNHKVLIENGIYLGDKNKLKNNENIYISGTTDNEKKIIKWSFEKIS